MDITVSPTDDIIIAAPQAAYLISSNAEEMKRDMSALLHTCSRLVLDLSQVRFIDSSGIGALLFCLRLANARGGGMKLCSMSPEVASVVQITRMNRILDSFEHCDEARRAFVQEQVPAP